MNDDTTFYYGKRHGFKNRTVIKRGVDWKEQYWESRGLGDIAPPFRFKLPPDKWDLGVWLLNRPNVVGFSLKVFPSQKSWDTIQITLSNPRRAWEILLMMGEVMPAPSCIIPEDMIDPAMVISAKACPTGVRRTFKLITGQTVIVRYASLNVTREHGFSPKLKQATVKQFAHQCAKCELSVSEGEYAIDHHFPYIRGGLSQPGNAVLLCKACNSEKYTKLPEEFYELEQLRTIQILLEEQREWAKKKK